MNHPRFSIDRRRFLSIGAAGVVASALATPRRAAADQMPGTGRAKSVILVLLSGGPSQLDTWDLKPEAPAEIRGEFSPIETAIPGISICEHMPILAAQMRHWSIIRSMSHQEFNHLPGVQLALTGHPRPVPTGPSDLDRVESRVDFPNYGGALHALRPRNDGIPSAVTLPNYLIEGPLTWPGQHAGFLGPKHDPWSINQDPNDPNFRVDSLTLQPGMSSPRLVSRRRLLDELNDSPTLRESTGKVASFAEQQEIAFSLLTSDRVAKAFEIQREDAAARDRYGRNKFGQSLLLSRRLVEAGVPYVQASMGIVQTWDTHHDNWGRLKNTLLPQLDRGLGALVDDLSASGLLDQTMIVVLGEFGRTPKVSHLPGQPIPGRDHWANAYSILFSGAGIRGGQVIGQTDSIAGFPISRRWTPADVCTTLYNALGIGPEETLLDPLGRTSHLMNGDIIEPLYTGRIA